MVGNNLAPDRGASPTALRRKAIRLREAGRWDVVAELVDSLPSSVISANPDLRLLKAEAALRHGDIHEAVRTANMMLDDNLGLPPSMRARALLVRSAASRLRGFIAKALEDASAAVALVQDSSSDVEVLVDGYRQLGVILGTAGELDRGLEHLDKALRLCARVSDLNLVASTHQAMGVALARLGQLAEAQVHFNNARVAYQKAGNCAELSTVLDNMGRLHYLFGDYTSALELFNESLKLAKGAKHHRTVAMTWINIGDTLQEMGQHQKALKSYQHALQPGTEAMEPRLFCCANVGLGCTYRALGEHAKARFHLEQASYEAARLDLKYELATASLQLGVLACEERDYARAKEELDRCVALSKESGVVEPLLHGSLSLAWVYLKTKRWALARSTLDAVAKLAVDLDAVSQLARHARALPELVSYAASKRIGGRLFQTLRQDLLGPRSQPLASVSQEKEAAEAWSRYPVVWACTLGAASVQVDDRPVSDIEWESQKAKELFFYLLCHRKAKSREELQEILWPELSASLSRNAFYNNVYRARRALYKDCIVLEDGMYRLNPKGEFWFDLSEFQKLTQDAERLPRGSEQAAALLEKAVALYAGPFLEQFEGEWTAGLRAQAEARYLWALEQLAGHYEAKGNVERAEALLKALLDVDDSNVAVRERLTKLLIARGDMVAARNSYSLYREAALRESGASHPKEFWQLSREARSHGP